MKIRTILLVVILMICAPFVDSGYAESVEFERKIIAELTEDRGLIIRLKEYEHEDGYPYYFFIYRDNENRSPRRSEVIEIPNKDTLDKIRNLIFEAFNDDDPYYIKRLEFSGHLVTVSKRSRRSGDTVSIKIEGKGYTESLNKEDWNSFFNQIDY